MGARRHRQPDHLRPGHRRSDTYDAQFGALIAGGHTVEEAYWDLVVDDVTAALGILWPTVDASGGSDGFLSIEVAPS